MILKQMELSFGLSNFTRTHFFALLLALISSSVMPPVHAADLKSIYKSQAKLVVLHKKHAAVPQPTHINGKFYCRSNSGLRVIDTSAKLDAAFLTRMKEVGIKVIARYYSYSSDVPPPAPETPIAKGSFDDGKGIDATEVALMHQFDMASVAVFQFRNKFTSTFAAWKTRGPADGKRALETAQSLGQPKGSVIYFTVDGDLVSDRQLPCPATGDVQAGNCRAEVTNYFKEISKMLSPAGYRLGVYGPGEACKMLTEAGLVKMCWLDFSLGHMNRTWGWSAKQTKLRQLPEAKGALKECGGRNIDFDEVTATDFGQFVYR